MTGCSNYHELNDLAIVSAIGIEKEEEKFKVTLELYREVKEGNSAKEESTTIEGTGKTIDEAINNSSLMSETLLYFSHIQAIIIDGDYAKEGISKMIDYLSRNTEFSFVSYVVVTEDKKPSEILSKKDIDNKIIGKAIASIFNITEQNSSNFVYSKYYDFLSIYVNERQDLYVPILKVKDKKLLVEDMVVFKDDQVVKKLDALNTKTFSLLINNSDSLFYKLNYEEQQVVLRIYEGKTKYKIRDGKIVIDINIISDIDEVDGNIDTLDEKVISKLEKKLENAVKNDVNDLVSTLKEVDSDALGLQDVAYDNYGKSEKSWKNYEIEVKVNNQITKKGLLMDPVRGGYEKD